MRNILCYMLFITLSFMSNYSMSAQDNEYICQTYREAPTTISNYVEELNILDFGNILPTNEKYELEEKIAKSGLADILTVIVLKDEVEDILKGNSFEELPEKNKDKNITIYLIPNKAVYFSYDPTLFKKLSKNKVNQNLFLISKKSKERSNTIASIEQAITLLKNLRT